MANWVFVPDDREKEIQTAMRSLSALLVKSTVVVTGSNALSGLRSEDPARLYVLGHGNWGAGIGTHKKHFGARTLTRALVAEGLSNDQINLEIHLFACNTGVAGAAVFHTRKPYVHRFAEALASNGFNNTRVFGYIGFLNIVTLRLHSQYKGGEMSGVSSAAREESQQVVYGVNAGQFTKMSGTSHGMKSTFAWRTVDVVPTT